MDDDSLRHRHNHKKHKHKHKSDHKSGHKSDRKSSKRHHGSDSEGEEPSPPPPQLQTEPWHGMRFELIDGIRDYGRAAPDSRTLRGLARVRAPDTFDMDNFARLVCYLRDTFGLDPEVPLVLRVSVCA